MEKRFSVASILKAVASLPVLLAASLLVAWMLWNRPANLMASAEPVFLPPSPAPKGSQVPEGSEQSSPSSVPSSGSSEAITPVTTDPNQLVLAAVRQAVWGPSIYCRVQQTTNAYGQRALLIGELKSEALSNSPMRRLRYTARVAVGETAFDLLQVYDVDPLEPERSPETDHPRPSPPEHPEQSAIPRYSP